MVDSTYVQTLSTTLTTRDTFVSCVQNLSSVYLNNIEIESLYNQLVEINSSLWDIEDKLRVIEKEKRFEGEFISLARKVYFTNDERFRLKNEINLLTFSEIREVKDYVKY